ncbi:putative GTPase-activating protein GYL1 [Candida viswanathii]|uniref:Oxidant-induced cell-cycle arrest protein 5 n=1 Tax=Candida viswanathii TaxID=5486 RepID=A0A367XMI4_9ASCO|nr:putative GTPase-activating protein GYL1 [Candida viswanathii]
MSEEAANTTPATSESSPPPPPLPPRKSLDAMLPTSPNGSDKKLPDLPLSVGQITFDLNDSVSQISAVRQFEIYNSAILNETSDLFINYNLGQNAIRSKLTTAEAEGSDEITEYWVSIIEDYSNQFLKNKEIAQLEQKIIKGIPDGLRYYVYLKTLAIRQKLNSKETFEGLLTKARQSRDEYIENLNVESKGREVLMVLNYYINEITNSRAEIESTADEVHQDMIQVPVSRFAINVCRLVSSLPDISQEEMFYLLLKFNRMFSELNRDEFFYKISRSLEEELYDEFKHISVQGINLNNLYRNITVQFLNSELLELQTCLHILDFVVFEGFDFVLRLVLSLFKSNRAKIMELDGDELLRFLTSPEFLTGVGVDFTDSLLQEPKIIQYENEFYLINANSLSNNSNELTNLKEVNDELVIKINELRRKIDSLQATHLEISNQSEEYTANLNAAEAENQKLSSIQAGLQEKYKHLTMAENLSNTIKANEEFSQRNDDMEQQIASLKKSIGEKKAKLAKVKG